MLALALDLDSIAAMGVGIPFDPATTAPTSWYDPSDSATMFQDTTGAVPVTATGQAVARINDKSGNAYHLTQATPGNQPTYQEDATGKYLLFDGVSDFLSFARAQTLPFDRISAIRQLSWTSADRIFHSGNANGSLYQNPATPQLRVYDGGTAATVATGGLAVGVNGVVTERHVAANSQLAINNGAYVSGDAGSLSPTSPMLVGATSTGTQAANFRWYGHMDKAGQFTADEITQLRQHFANKAGVAL